MAFFVQTLILVVFFGLYPTGPANAGQDEITIGILRFQTSGRVPESVATSIEQMVYSKFAERRRLRVIERSNISAIHAELAAQDIMGVADKTALASVGANYVVLGQVTQADVRSSYGSQGTTLYSAVISYGLRIIDVSTGAVAHSESFSNGRGNPFANTFSSFTGDTSNPAGAIDIAIRQTAKQLDSFLSTSFPTQGRLISIEARGRRGAAEAVLVTLGVAEGVTKRSKAVIYHQETLEVDGKPLIRKRPLAELRFLRAEGEQLSVFKVTKATDSVEGAVGSDSVFVELLP